MPLPTSNPGALITTVGGIPGCRIALYVNSIDALQVRTAARQGAKFSSRSGALLAKQRRRAPGRSQGPSPHPASSRDGDGAQNAAVLACCGLMEARTRVRARAACKVCVCVQYRNRENIRSKSAPRAFSSRCLLLVSRDERPDKTRRLRHPISLR